MDGLIWNDGAPYLGANSGIDPGQTLYWHEGVPFLNFYEATTSVNFKKFMGVATASIKKINGVAIASVKKVNFT